MRSLPVADSTIPATSAGSSNARPNSRLLCIVFRAMGAPTRRVELKLSERLQGFVDVMILQRRRDLHSQARLPLWDHWISERHQPHAQFQKSLAFFDRIGGVTDHDGDDRRG